MEAYTPELEPEVKERTELIQQVIDRLVGLDSVGFTHDLKHLFFKYPANERPLDYTAPNLILMNGEVLK